MSNAVLTALIERKELAHVRGYPKIMIALIRPVLERAFIGSEADLKAAVLDGYAKPEHVTQTTIGCELLIVNTEAE